jgi:hypothetical protein
MKQRLTQKQADILMQPALRPPQQRLTMAAMTAAEHQSQQADPTSKQ